VTREATAAEVAAPPVSEAAIDALFARADAARWDLSRDAFAVAVRRAVSAIAGASAEPTRIEAIVAGLHAADLALALACAAGHGAAWDHFVLTFRPELYRAARAMTYDATGRELADSLYADLFGLDTRDGERRSLFRYYHGRAKLSTWLRSVLAQRHVDVVRARKRTTSLDDDPEQPVEARLVAAPAVDAVTASSMRLAALAVTAALDLLTWDDRRRLAYYYVHGMKLLAIGRAFDESEATASRKLERARQALRAAIEAELAARGLSSRDVDDWSAVARQAWDAALADALGVPPPQESPSPSFQKKRMP
jgi:RNA polymerase sigma-70 factor (ECF subfamily)